MHKKTWLISLSLSGIIFASGVFEVKVICLLVLILRFLQLRRLSHKYVFFVLLTVYSFAFIFTPYWQAFGIPAIGFPLLKYIVLVLLTIFGFLWARAVGGKIRMPKINTPQIFLILLGIALYAVNFRPIAADIAWRGDEDSHINTVLNLVEYLTFYAWQWDIYILRNTFFGILAAVGGGGLILIGLGRYVSHSWSKWIRLIGKYLLLLCLPILAIAVFGDTPFQKQEILMLNSILRYPFVQKWLNLLFVIPNPYHDIRLYRLAPFLSSVLISWYLFIAFERKLRHQILSFCLALAFSTVPLQVYYSSMLYLEMPIVLLTLICIFNLPALITEDLSKLKSRPAWYALIFLSFLKEIALIIPLLILCLRLMWKVRERSQFHNLSAVLLQEAKSVFWVISPGLIFLGFRQMFSFIGRFRYIFYLPYILNPNSYSILIKVLTLQMGIIFIVGIFACLNNLIRRKSWLTFGPLIFLLIAVLWFFMSYHYEGFVHSGKAMLLLGYSRWNLFLLPLFYFAAFQFIIAVKRSTQILIFLIIVIFNAYLFPFKEDGVRVYSWGGASEDFAEYTYPYEAAVRYLSQEKEVKDLLHLGHYSPYGGFPFYFHKYQIGPKVIEYEFGQQRFTAEDEKLKFTTFMSDMSKQRLSPEILAVDTILYHSVNNLEIDQGELYGGKFKIVRRIQNSLHSLYIFRKVIS